MNSYIKCVECGRFMGEHDFTLGCCDYTPETEFGHERIEWSCQRCAIAAGSGTAETNEDSAQCEASQSGGCETAASPITPLGTS